MAYIDKNKLGIGKCNPDVFENKGYAKGWNDAIEIIENQPAADVVEVVRCKDCKCFVPFKENVYCKGCCASNDGLGDFVKPNDFCSYGERKDEE